MNPRTYLPLLLFLIASATTAAAQNAISDLIPGLSPAARDSFVAHYDASKGVVTGMGDAVISWTPVDLDGNLLGFGDLTAMSRTAGGNSELITRVGDTLIFEDSANPDEGRYLTGALTADASTDYTAIWQGHYDSTALFATSGTYAFNLGLGDLSHQRDDGGGGFVVELYNGITYAGDDITDFDNQTTVWSTIVTANSHTAFANQRDLNVAGSPTYNVQANPELVVGAFGSGGFDFVGEMKHLIFFRDAISESDRTLVQSYLNVRSGQAIYVTTATDELDEPGTGLSLREAIAQATEGQSILFHSSLSGATLNLQNGATTLGELVIDKSLIIDASNLSDGFIIDGGSNGDFVTDPGETRCLFVSDGEVGNAINVTLKNLTIRNGVFDGDRAGANLYNERETVFLDTCEILLGRAFGGESSDASGGGIYSSGGSLTLTDCTVSHNQTQASTADGGGIYSDGNLTLTHCTVSHNQTQGTGTAGGGISSDGNLTLTHCTVSHNQSQGRSAKGGGIYSSASAVLTNCTLVGNVAQAAGGAYFNRQQTSRFIHCTVVANSALSGSGIASWGDALTSTELTGCVVRDNLGGGEDLDLFSQSTNSFVSNGSNLVGTLGTDVSGFAGEIDPTTPILLAPLGDYGGPTPTRPPFAGSPLIDAAAVLTPELTTDQRGFARPLDGDGDDSAAPDIGAVELSALFVTTATDEVDNPGTGLSLREAIAQATEGQSILFDPSVITPGNDTIVLTDGPLDLQASLLSIDGGNLPRGVRISGNDASRVFTIALGSRVFLSKLIIERGKAPDGSGGGAGAHGGGIHNAGELTLTDCAVLDCAAGGGDGSGPGGNGGGIFNFADGILTLESSTLARNRAGRGGPAGGNGGSGGGLGGFMGSASTLINSTVADNRAGAPGSAAGMAGNGGGIDNPQFSDTTMVHVTISSNGGARRGGGIHTEGRANLSIENSIVAANQASEGPDIFDTANGDQISSKLSESGSNFIGDSTGAEDVFPAPSGSGNDFVGTPAGPLDPRLTPLAHFGGCAPTLHPLVDSPVIDAAAATTLVTDQRGFPRTVDGNVPTNASALPDIGAVEAGPAFVVDTSTDNPAPPTITIVRLRDAVASAAGTPGSRVVFNDTVFPQTITLTQGEIAVDDATFFIDASNFSAPGVTVSGGNANRIFNFDENNTIALHSLTLTGGAATGNGGGQRTGPGSVNAILHSTLAGNASDDSGGAVAVELGGSLDLINATLNDNTAVYRGGGLSANGRTTVRHSTIAGNRTTDAYGAGGGISRPSGSSGPLVMTNTLVAGNTTGPFGPDFFAEVISEGGNLVGNNSNDFAASFPAGLPNLNGDYAGSSGAPLDPLLGPLADNGGPTQTMALQAGSLAIDNGGPGGPPTDQRGLPRVRDGDGDFESAIDIGAFEAAPPPIVVNTAADENDGLLVNGISLRDAIAAASDPVENTILFDASLSGAATLNLQNGTTTLGQLVINKSLIIDATNLAGGFIIDGGSNGDFVKDAGETRCLFISDGDDNHAITVILKNLTIRNGAFEGDNAGANLHNDRENVFLDSCEVLHGRAFGGSREDADGGGIYSEFGDLTLTGCTVSHNQTQGSGANGGGIICLNGDLTLTGCTVSHNQTHGSSADGGGIFRYGSFVMTNCTLVGNVANMAPGGAVFNGLGTSQLIHCTVVENRAPSGSGIASYGDAATLTELTGCVVRDNTGGGNDLDLVEEPHNSFVSKGSNFVGTLGANVSGFAVSEIDPTTPILLAPLGDYGGPTLTRPPCPGSPLIDAAAVLTPALTTDQRGLARPFDGDGDGSAAPDIGAVELTALFVSNTNDSGAGSLRARLNEAAANPGADTIVFDPSLDGATVSLASTLTITDPDGVTLDASCLPGGFTLDDDSATSFPLILVDSGARLTLLGLTLANGGGADRPGSGGSIVNRGTLNMDQCAILAGAAGDGGALYNDGGVATLIQCQLSGNKATGRGGAIYNEIGTLTLVECALSSNTASNGGAIHNEATLTLVRCTLSENEASDEGGALFQARNSLTMEQCTLIGNVAAVAGGAVYLGINGNQAKLRSCTLTGNQAPMGAGGGVANGGSEGIAITHTIIAGNRFSDVDLVGGTTDPFLSEGHNLIGTGSGAAGFDQTGDQTGIADPLLAPLGLYGGPTETRPPCAGSPAIDAGVAIAGLDADQRGFARPLDGDASGTAEPDIGAVELSALFVTTVVDETEDPGTGLSLREAIAEAVEGQSILFDSALPSNTLNLQNGATTLGELVINKSLIIDASNLPDGFIIDGGSNGDFVKDDGETRCLFISDGDAGNALAVTLKNLTIRNGVFEGDDAGANLHNDRETVFLDTCQVLHGRAFGGSREDADGGGIYSEFGDLTLTGCTVSHNQTQGSDANGGGIFSLFGDLTLTGCTVSHNEAQGSNADGGGIWKRGPAALTNCTLVGNVADAAAGAYLNFDQTSQFIHCTVVENRAPSGSGIASYGDADTLTELSGCVVRDNFGGGGKDLDLYFDDSTNSFVSNGSNFVGTLGTNVSGFAANEIDATTPILLAPLGDYGGPTPTRPPLPGSPVIDAALGSAVTGDQRGFPIMGSGRDIGAAEAQAFLLVDTRIDESTANSTTSLREALAQATGVSATPGTFIMFDPAVFTAADHTILLTSGQLEIPSPSALTIYASDLPGGVTIDAQNASRHFFIGSNAAPAAPTSANLHSLQLIGGSVSGFFPDNAGGALLNRHSSLTLINTLLSGNAANTGGAVYLGDAPSTTLINCAFQGNLADIGGGLRIANSPTTVLNGTFQGNRATTAGGAVSIAGAAPSTFTNTLIWSNQQGASTSDTGASIANNSGSSPTYHHSLIENLDLSATGAGNLDGTNSSNDPLFLQEVDPASAPMIGGDLRLPADSPAIDLGDSLANGTNVDLAGNPREAGAAIDLGAYELLGDSDADGLPDFFELMNTSPSDAESLSPGDDQEGDGLTALEEFAHGTSDLAFDADGEPVGGEMETGGMRYQTIRYRRNWLALPFLDIVCQRSTDMGIADDWSTGETVEMSAIPNPKDAGVDDVTERSLISIDDQAREFLQLSFSKR